MLRIAPLFAAVVLTVAAGSSLAAKNEKVASTPALHGYCPVAYVAMGKAVKGDARVSVVHEGQRYLFTNADAKKMFAASPGKYEVAYGGWCATAVAMGKKLESDPTLFTVHDGRTFLFSSADAKKAFDEGPDGVVEKADEQWAGLAKKAMETKESEK